MADAHSSPTAGAPGVAPTSDAHGVGSPSELHRHERPEDWGWHASMGKGARFAGWFSVLVLCLLNVTTYYNTSQAPWIYGIAAVLVLLLVRDRYRRKNAWRDE
jgi:hypothetical protein